MPGAGVTELVLFATETPTPAPIASPTSTPGPTPSPTPDSETNRPTAPPGPRAVPTPHVLVEADAVNGHRGPAVTFPILGRAARGTELMILARTPDGAWWQICCIANQPAWVPAELVTARGALDGIPVLTPPPTPTSTPRPPPPPTSTPVPTPLPPFDIARGPEFPLKVDDGRLTIWVKVYEGPTDNQKPLPGYVLKVFRDGVDVSRPTQSSDRFDEIASFSGSTKTVLYYYNLKFELPQGGEADWEIHLARPDGYRVSPVSRFTTKGDSYRNLVVYIAYWLAR